MASTNKTANLGLSQWVASDAVEMSDFNADNLLIDAAMGKRMEVELLRDVTTDQRVGGIHIDLSDLDFSKYLILAVSCDNTPDLTIRNETENGVILGNATDASTTFFFPLRDTSRRICSFATMSYNSVVISSMQFKALKSLMLYVSSTSSAIIAGAKVRIWGVK